MRWASYSRSGFGNACFSLDPENDFTTKLIDVFPDGRAIYLCQGVIRSIGAPEAGGTRGRLVLEFCPGWPLSIVAAP